MSRSLCEAFDMDIGLRTIELLPFTSGWTTVRERSPALVTACIPTQPGIAQIIAAANTRTPGQERSRQNPTDSPQRAADFAPLRGSSESQTPAHLM
jgi:hypothetical protein